VSIGTYAELQTAVGNWITNGAVSTTRIQEGIALAEAKINRRIRTLEMVTKNTTFSITGEYVATPTNFGGVKTFYLNASPKQDLTYMDDGQMAAYSTTTKPKYFNVQGSNFRFAPVPDATYSSTLVYYLKVPALTASNTTNWLLTSHPDAYLYGTLAEMEAFVKNWEAASNWEKMLYTMLDEVAAQSKRDQASGSSLATRPDSTTP
jgi:hypothetical protein